ncbi:MAG TPA: CDP-glucose 4,6-dehydratase [Ruminiclostridium sp.]|nr:CDP-glucose 4,6-dehydratase [Ruminiclostridium sp.]
MINRNFWSGKRVFITGHTGFKGSWLCLLLHSLGANITGYALKPPTNPSMYELCGIEHFVNSVTGDIRNTELLSKVLCETEPEIVIHMAAQPLVRESYRNPVETYEINTMGTVYLLDGIRKVKSVKSVVNVTTDKCYENKEWNWGYREIDTLGGYDPYSNSKSCSEMVTLSYRNSFFNPKDYKIHGVGVASARAGNVIGGGDWADDRLVPDCLRAIFDKRNMTIRNPASIRPWQHVLEPLYGYILLAQRLYSEGDTFASGWNFGPNDDDAKPVEWIVNKIYEKWGSTLLYATGSSENLHEANYLKLDCSKAKAILGWSPKWNLEQAIEKVVEWAKAYKEGKDLLEISLKQIEEYLADRAAHM